MKMSLVTDCLGDLSFEDMTDTASSLGYELLEFATGNWSKAPHLNLDELLESNEKRTHFLDTLKKKNLSMEVLNCSGNQLAPNEDGEMSHGVVEKTFKLAELFDVKTIVMMSGLPGGGPNDTTPNWITTSWPPINNEILEWQWNEVAFPYWEKLVQKAQDYGIEKIAIENHGSQLVYNPETLFKLRNQIGDMIGMNFDPSHLLWMGGDPIIAARTLGDAIYHVHAKDTRLERGIVHSEGVLDTKTIDRFSERSWNYVALGHGQDILWWKELFSVLSMTGYSGPISLENEDLTMDSLTALKKATDVLKSTMPRVIK